MNTCRCKKKKKRPQNKEDKTSIVFFIELKFRYRSSCTVVILYLQALFDKQKKTFCFITCTFFNMTKFSYTSKLQYHNFKRITLFLIVWYLLSMSLFTIGLTDFHTSLLSVRQLDGSTEYTVHHVERIEC